MTELLRVQGVSKRFAGIMALDDVSISVEAGERVGLIGPNGAGKTTFFNCMLGVIRMDRGRVEREGNEIGRRPVHERARLGIGRTFQRLELFPDTTVRDHLFIAERIRRGKGGLWRDVIGIVLVRGDALDRSYLRETADQLDLRDLLERALRDADSVG